MYYKKYITALLSALAVCLSVGCTKYNLIDTGLPDPDQHKQKTMWQYFEGDPYNWSMTQALIERAEMREVFEGKSEYGDKLTFFGITNHSIRKWILDTYYPEQREEIGVSGPTEAELLQKIEELPIEECQTVLRNALLPERLMRDDFPRGIASTDVNTPIGRGGKMYTMLSGKELWIYTFRGPFNETPGKGAVSISLVSPETTNAVPVASSDIVTKTGIVHSLQYTFTPKDL